MKREKENEVRHNILYIYLIELNVFIIVVNSKKPSIGNGKKLPEGEDGFFRCEPLPLRGIL